MTYSGNFPPSTICLEDEIMDIVKGINEKFSNRDTDEEEEEEEEQKEDSDEDMFG
jgi:hypothetical protein